MSDPLLPVKPRQQSSLPLHVGPAGYTVSRVIIEGFEHILNRFGYEHSIAQGQLEKSSTNHQSRPEIREIVRGIRSRQVEDLGLGSSEIQFEHLVVWPVRPVFGRFSASVQPFSAPRTLSSVRHRLWPNLNPEPGFSSVKFGFDPNIRTEPAHHYDGGGRRKLRKDGDGFGTVHRCSESRWTLQYTALAFPSTTLSQIATRIYLLWSPDLTRAGLVVFGVSVSAFTYALGTRVSLAVPRVGPYAL
ncbi:hypothetical protein C8F01DRAFT_1078484 [Mycena amicta]|nr:hypothetical protein C8F01DRAFT_1078484 [Mycena amicta]